MKLLLILENRDLINYFKSIISLECDEYLLLSPLSFRFSTIDEYNPDWIIIDIWLTDKNSFELAESIRQQFPDSKIGLLSDNLDERLQNEATRIGVDAFISKELLFELYDIIGEKVIHDDSWSEI